MNKKEKICVLSGVLVCTLCRADCRMVKMLLSRGAQVNVADVVGNTPLHTATIYGHTELVKVLLQHSAEVYRKGQHGALPIHMAAHEGHANLVRLFCQFAEVGRYILFFNAYTQIYTVSQKTSPFLFFK